MRTKMILKVFIPLLSFYEPIPLSNTNQLRSLVCTCKCACMREYILLMCPSPIMTRGRAGGVGLHFNCFFFSFFLLLFFLSLFFLFPFLLFHPHPPTHPPPPTCRLANRLENPSVHPSHPIRTKGSTSSSTSPTMMRKDIQFFMHDVVLAKPPLHVSWMDFTPQGDKGVFMCRGKGGECAGRKRGSTTISYPFLLSRKK